MTDKPDIAANASANYLFHRLNEAIGTIATQTGTIAELQSQLAEAQMPKKPIPKTKPVGQSAKQTTGKLKSRTGPR